MAPGPRILERLDPALQVSLVLDANLAVPWREIPAPSAAVAALAGGDVAVAGRLLE
jgi:hypothetical protein